MKKNQIAIIGIVGLPARYGGFETLTEYLTKYLGKKYDFTVYCSGKIYKNRLAEHNNATLVYLPLNANGVQSILYDILSIFNALIYADTLLILGVSGCIILPLVKRISSKKIIVNIDGLEWRRDKWNKYARWFLRFSEKIAVRYADEVIADNEAIQDYVAAQYRKPSRLIAYGADQVKRLAISQEILEKYPFLHNSYAFTVCRIEPENNIHIILEAVTRQNKLPMVFIGNWKVSQYGLDLYAKYSGIEHIHLLDPIYDQAILDQFRSNCMIYLHGHSAGGTNPSLVEAMYLGLTIFAYGVTYNKKTTEYQAQYFSNADDLVRLLLDYDVNFGARAGEQMSEIANRLYRWEVVAAQYAVLFDKPKDKSHLVAVAFNGFEVQRYEK
jgi:hypothetical protein